MTRKQNRTAIIVASLLVLGVAAGLVLYAMRGTIVYFYTPSEVVSQKLPIGARLRLGGLVEKGSIVKSGTTTTFLVTDMTDNILVSHTGPLPDLFREGQGVVVEGALSGDNLMTADSVLAKHDENYMPKDVADKLKAQGVWKEGTPAP
jgi:cytochrome c-type biogenesis protein CcmE